MSNGDDVDPYRRDQTAGRPDRWCRRGTEVPTEGNSSTLPSHQHPSPSPHRHSCRRAVGTTVAGKGMCVGLVGMLVHTTVVEDNVME